MAITNPLTTTRAVDGLSEAATRDSAAVLQSLGSSPIGLTEAEAEARLIKYGPNEVAHERKHEWLHRLWTAVRNPLVVLLTVLSILSYATDDIPGGTVMLAMVILGVALRLVQETRAGNAAAKLKAMIKVTATVLRDGQQKEIPLQQLVPGDVVKLSAGDMIPGDVRLIAAKDLFIIQATLTGESLPVEKHDATDMRTGVSSIEHTNICFLGTSVESGAATGVIVATGAQTYFGKMASSLSGQQTETIIGNISGVRPTATAIAKKKASFQLCFIRPLMKKTSGTITSMKVSMSQTYFFTPRSKAVSVCWPARLLAILPK